MISPLIRGRLPATVIPNHYSIDLTVDPNDGGFSGTVLIQLSLEKPLKVLHLHALDLDIQGARSGPFEAEVLVDEESETISLCFQEALAAGACSLTLIFSGRLNKQMRGLYATEHEGHCYAFTQFEATDARRMFPCFDEPGYKAIFSLSVTAPSDLLVLSNMPKAFEEDMGEVQCIQFEETPLMSTYLLALGIAHLVEDRAMVGEMPVSVWVLPGQEALSGFALKVCEAVLPLLNDYFDYDCPTRKLDLVCVPDFAMGAMENWGAIFFRDSRLLLDEQSASTQTKQDVANVITHEIVHQWFGNLVTMKWWDDLWLNESFATWLACKIVDEWRPEWQAWDLFQQDKALPLLLDALKSSRAIHAEVENAAEIEEMFDVLTYEKGGACLRMIEQFLGEDVFRAGMRLYIKRFAYQNASADDLWTALEEVSSQPVSDIAHDWFHRRGYPLIQLSVSEDQQLVLQQGPFCAGELEAAAAWTIPFRFRYADDAGEHEQHIILSAQNETFDLSASGRLKWLFGNVEGSGFFRIQYDEQLRLSHRSILQSVLSPSEKVVYLSDLWALCARGSLPLSDFMSCLMQFQGDDTAVLVSEVCSYLEILFLRVVAPQDRAAFSRFAFKLLNPLWKVCGWDAGPGESESQRGMRADLLWVMGSVAQNEELLSELPRRQTRYLARPSSVDPILFPNLLKLFARSDGGTRFKQFLERFKRSETPERRDHYLLALAEFNKPSLAVALVEFLLSDDVRSQDLWKPFRSLLSNPNVQSATWESIKKHWPRLREKGGTIAAQRIIQATRGMWSQEFYKEVSQFFSESDRMKGLGEKTLAQSLEFIQLGVAFRDRQSRCLSEWLKVEMDRPT